MWLAGLLINTKEYFRLTDFWVNLYTEPTNSLEITPVWEAASRSTTQEFPNVLWNPKIHYRAHKSPRLVPSPSHINPVYIIPFYVIKIHFNIILPPMIRSSYLFFLLAFPPKPICMNLKSWKTIILSIVSHGSESRPISVMEVREMRDHLDLRRKVKKNVYYRNFTIYSLKKVSKRRLLTSGFWSVLS
jgi:hypothetical protein